MTEPDHDKRARALYALTCDCQATVESTARKAYDKGWKDADAEAAYRRGFNMGQCAARDAEAVKMQYNRGLRNGWAAAMSAMRNYILDGADSGPPPEMLKP